MKNSRILVNIFLFVVLSSCARAPARYHTLPQPYPAIPEKIITTPEPFLRSDIYHEVAPGETTWRISKMYDVEIEDIVVANNLRDAVKLEKGQRLLIPNAAPLKSVIPLYPSRKWDYIVIHHSATDVGNALNFDKAHIKRRWKGLGYHFVIDNGTSGKQDGQIEISPRWIHQEDGAHCKAGGMNYKGIGVCLVGNFSEDRVTKNQMDSLVLLVNELKKYYNVSDSYILGHGQVKGSSTECPGKRFPWNEFRRRLTP